MQYEVVRFFTDAQDNEHPYNEGDIYPRGGLSVSQERIRDLMNGNNFQRVQLIKPIFNEKKVEKVAKKIVEKVEEKSQEIGREEISKMPYMKLKSVAKSYGIDVNDKKAADIRAELIEKLGL